MTRLAVAALLAVAACGGPEEAAPVERFETTALKPPANVAHDSPEWTASAEDDRVIARVGGVPITERLLLAQREAHPDVPLEALLQRLIELEVVAQAANQQGYGDSPAAVEAWRDALVHAWLTRFPQRYTPEDIPMERVEMWWKGSGKLRSQFNHADRWLSVHIVVTCCNPKAEGDCELPEAINCFAESPAILQRVYDRLEPRVRDLASEPEEVATIAEAFVDEFKVEHPAVAFQRVPFFYDPKKSYEEQRGYALMAENYATTVIALTPGVLSKPFQTEFGWHIAVLLDHVPERRSDLSDPSVVAEIRENAYPRFQQISFGNEIVDLIERYDVQIREPALELLTGANAPKQGSGGS